MDADGNQVIGPDGNPVSGPDRANFDTITSQFQGISDLKKFASADVWDFQRVTDDFGSIIFTEQYRDFSNIAIGYTLASGGYGWTESAAIADGYSWWYNHQFTEPMSLVFWRVPAADVTDYQIGAQLWTSIQEAKNPAINSPFDIPGGP